jgi:hypothetical protein
MIKYSIAREICKLNLECNSDKIQNREIIKSLLKASFLPNFGENFEINKSLGML